MKLKYKLMSTLAVIGVVGTGLAAWQFGNETAASAQISVSVAGYSAVGLVSIAEVPDYILDDLNDHADSNNLYFTATYNPSSDVNAIDVANIALTYRVTFLGGLAEYVYPHAETALNSGIHEGTWVSGTQVTVPVKWRAGKNPTSLAAHTALSGLLTNFSIQIEVFANLAGEEPDPEPLLAPDTIELSGVPTDNKLVAGNSIRLGALAKASGSADGVDQGVTWSSSNQSVATIDEDGELSAIAAGTSTISATSSHVSPLRRAEGDPAVASFVLTVVAAPDLVPASVVLDKPSLSVAVGADSDALVATVKNATGQTLTHDVVWSVINRDGTASVSGGVVTGLDVGTAKVKATAQGYDNVYAECNITITAAGPDLTPYSISLDKTSIVVPVSYSAPALIATVKNAGGEVLEDVDLTWSVPTGSLFASVSSGGVVTGKATPSTLPIVKVEVSDNSSIYATCSVTVEARRLETVQIGFDGIENGQVEENIAATISISYLDQVNAAYEPLSEPNWTISPNTGVVNKTAGVYKFSSAVVDEYEIYATIESVTSNVIEIEVVASSSQETFIGWGGVLTYMEDYFPGCPFPTFEGLEANIISTDDQASDMYGSFYIIYCQSTATPALGRNALRDAIISIFNSLSSDWEDDGSTALVGIFVNATHNCKIRIASDSATNSAKISFIDLS